jgi:hypothetical protein
VSSANNVKWSLADILIKSFIYIYKEKQRS